MSSIERVYVSGRMSKIVRFGGFVFLCGQTSDDSNDIARQTTAVLAKIDNLLFEAGSDKSKLLSATIYLKNIEDFAAMNVVWDAWVATGCPPARTTVEAGLARAELLVEVTVIAAS